VSPSIDLHFLEKEIMPEDVAFWLMLQIRLFPCNVTVAESPQTKYELNPDWLIITFKEARRILPF